MTELRERDLLLSLTKITSILSDSFKMLQFEKTVKEKKKTKKERVIGDIIKKTSSAALRLQPDI